MKMTMLNKYMTKSLSTSPHCNSPEKQKSVCFPG